MSEPAYNYTPVALNRKFEKQAVKAWAVGSAIVLTWILLISAAPLLKASAAESFADPLYRFFSYFCHQIPERSLYLQGSPLAVCSRCLGVYSGLLGGFVAYPLWRRLAEIEPTPRIWLFLSMVPIAIDWSLTAFGVWENTHLSRFSTGAILGFACGVYIVPAIVEITRNFTFRRVRPT